MKTLAIVCASFLFLIPITAGSQTKLVDRTTVSNGKELHFQILEGRKDDIILFESGGGGTTLVCGKTCLLPLQRQRVPL